MADEFNLSSKHYNNIRVYAEEDVKEFIKRLKEDLPDNPDERDKFIDKLAGDKLI